MKKLCMLCVALLAAAVFFHSAPTQSSAKTEKFLRSSQPVPDRYIVVLNKDASESGTDKGDTIAALNREFPGSVKNIYSSAISGYSVEMTEDQAKLLSEDPRVKYVEEDGVVLVQATQASATWGISRIDQRDWVYPLDTNYDYNATGAGVSVYVIDTGILTTHPDFGGRAVNAFDAYHDGTLFSDCNGHGTHVAGTIGSATYGVAKNVTLYSVKVFPCWGSGTMSDVIAGVDWVTRHANHPSVANMSLAGPYSSALEDAVQKSIDSGITYVVAAGNYGSDACNYSPAHLGSAITVGSTDQRDYRDSISDYGPCVDIFA